MAVKSREYALPALPAKSELGSHYFIPNGVGNNVDHYIGVSGGLFAKVDTGGGGGGGGGTSNQIFNETPTGIMNGVNKVFTTSSSFEPKTTRLYLNGQRLKLVDDYHETGANQITFQMAFIPPISTDNMIIDYQLT